MVLDALVQEGRHIAHQRTQTLAEGDEVIKQLLGIDEAEQLLFFVVPGRTLVDVVDADQLRVLQLGNRLQVLHQFLVVEDLANLNALFHVFIGIEWRNARLGGAVGLVRQAHLLQRIELNVISAPALCRKPAAWASARPWTALPRPVP